MYVSTSEKALLKVLFDVVAANGRPPQIDVRELAERIERVQAAGVPVYSTTGLDDLQVAVRADARMLEKWGLLRLTNDGRAELTGAGELLGGTLEFPEWAQTSMNQRHVV